MNAIAAVAALSVAALTLWALLRAGVGGRLVADPSGERWHTSSTPTFGGVGIFLGLVAGVGAAVAVGATDASSELLGILGGCTILFVAGFVDDVYTLKPIAKLVAQFAAAGVVLASGLTVEIFGNDVLATVLGLVWLVGITNAFNLLDNMDGLAASLAAVSCAVFAVAALDQDAGELALVVALALGGACLGFLPFNLRPGRSARVFMGDSGSQVIGFGLASLALASSWTTAGATLTSIVLPLLVLAIPILDTTLVTVRRTLERRPVTQGGTDHSSHRLVYYGLSEQQAVAALTLLAALLGATALAYNVLANARVTAIGLLISFVVLVQFASFLGDLQERSRREDPGPAPPLWRAFLSNPRRLVEVLVDFAIVCVSFLAAYLLFVDGGGTYVQRGIFLATLPILLGVRYVLFVLFGIYRRIWRFASARDLLAIGAAVVLSAPLTIGIVRATRPLTDFPLEIFLVDALLCMTLVAASRLALRLLPGLEQRARPAEARPRRRRRAAPAGRSRASWPRRPTTRVVGFVDDNPAAAPAADPRRHRPRRPRRRRAAARRAAGRRGARDDPRRCVGPAGAARRRLHRRRRRLPLRRPRDRAAAVSDPRARRVTPDTVQDDERLTPGVARWLLGVAYLCLASLFAWQASQRVSPSIFSDEIEFTQISRGIAETGRPSRLGEPSGFGSLYTYLVAPAWWLDPTDGLGGGEADRRARDDGGDLPGVRAGALRRLAAVGDRRRDRRRRGAAARLRAVPARGAARVSLLDDGALGDHGRDRPADARPARARRGALPRRAVRPRRARGAAGGLRRRPLLPALADRRLHALALDAGAPATGSARRCSSSASRSSSAPRPGTSRTPGTSRRASRSSASSTTASGRSRR